jgi:hypothetical protein
MTAPTLGRNGGDVGASAPGARRSPIDRGLRAASIALVTALAAVGLALPDSLVYGGAAWLAFLCFVFSGWGYLALRLVRLPDMDFGLRASWGVAGVLAVAGVLVALGGANQGALRGLLAVGLAAVSWREWVTPAPMWRALVSGWRAARRQPALATVVALLVAFAALRVLGAVADVERNVWDDDISYLPLQRRLLDLGDLIEPFSFRRMSAYGGQFVLQAMVAARGTLSNVHLFDKGLCFGLTLLSVLGLGRARPAGAEGPIGVEGRGGAEGRSWAEGRGLWTALVVLFLLMLPDVGVNIASHWSGVLLFVALYRTVAGAEAAADASAARWLAVAGGVAAAVTTLRQNYAVVAVLFLALALASRLTALRRERGWSAAWNAERGRWVITASAAALAVLPWCVAAYASNRTFLFPFVPGTWNRGLSLVPLGGTWLQELGYYAYAVLEAEPLSILAPLCVLLAFARDRRLARPLSAFFLASLVGALLLFHALVGSDVSSLWRYLYGAGIALTVVFALEAGGTITADERTDGASAPLVHLPPLGRWILLAALLLQLVSWRAGLPKQVAAMVRAIAHAQAIDGHGDPTAVAERRRYQAMQASVPAGQALAVMVDDPAYLDFARNRIANLDTPGYASPGTQLPNFVGPEAIRRYFLAQGVRYLAFVRPERSRYFYRRSYWIRELYLDIELFQVMAAYLIDTIDSFVALAATSPPLYDVEGLVVLDLAAGAGGSPAPPPAADPAGEPRRRDAWARAFAERNGSLAAWALSPRQELSFADGFSGLVFQVDERDVEVPPPPRLSEPAAATLDPLRRKPVRWIQRRGHLRVRGDGDRVLALAGQILPEATGTRPRLDVSLDGELVASSWAAADGSFAIEARVDAAKLRRWADVYLVFSSVGVPERDPRELRFARLDAVQWRAP